MIYFLTLCLDSNKLPLSIPSLPPTHGKPVIVRLTSFHHCCKENLKIFSN